jgi:4-aminobutyrate aminotransferase-like enzyme
MSARSLRSGGGSDDDVRYCRSWPVVFDRAPGCAVYDESGRGHLGYIARDGVTHALDMYTVAKREFLETLHELVLRQRDLDHKVVFPDGTLAGRVACATFRRGLLVETAGPDGEVIKLMPPLVVTEAETERGLAILRQCTHEVLRERTEPRENP